MLHIVEVDQSGKFEDTKVNTVLAFSNGISFSILVPATVKRSCIQILRRLGYTGQNLYLRLFTVGLYLLFKEYIDQIDCMTIDYEYLGKESLIREQLLNSLRKIKPTLQPDQIQFHHIGKQSTAHYAAYETLTGKRLEGRRISEEEILNEFKQ